MPRKPRFFLPNVPVHVVQRGNNRDPIFYDESDYQSYLEWLDRGAKACDCQIHAYVLMTNHVHILASPKDKDGISRLMQYIGRFYVSYINHTYHRTGTLWEGRFKSSLIQDEEYLLRCMRYIELNPMRANLVSKPQEYPWSSYARNAYGKKNPIITPHKIYTSLGKDSVEQRKAYRSLFKQELNEQELTDIRAALQTGTPLGTKDFKDKIEKVLKVKLGYSKRGRPSLK